MNKGYREAHKKVDIGVGMDEIGSFYQNKKHPIADRDGQFEYINRPCKEANAKGIPVIAIDTKKKEHIGNFKNNGKIYQPQGNPIEVLDHDVPLKELGKVTPAFAVESMRKWWYAQGLACYGAADELVVTADCGGSKSYRNRLWKYELQKLANEIGKNITVLHYPSAPANGTK